jgi:N-sulfoglucosamine sulfohydrolase
MRFPTQPLVFLSLGILLSLSARAKEGSRLNILFVFADDWGRYASAYAKVDGRPSLNDVIQTPHVDRVASEGVLFVNAFVNAPSCTPCRSSLLSGRHFFQTGRGAILQGAVWDEQIPTFPLMLQAAGYHIGKSFKVWSPGKPADAGFGGQRHAYQRTGGACNNFSEEVSERVSKGQSVTEARADILAQVRGNFDEFLASRKQGQPWLYWFGPTTTHRKWVKGSGKKLWGIEPENLKGRLPAFLPDVPEVREDVADYLGECQAVDAYVGELMKRLEECGELEKTVIVLSGDHGMPGVPHGKCNVYDHGTAVALAIRYPGSSPGRILKDIVRIPDLCPTFLEIGGVPPPENLYGKSLLPLLQSQKSELVDSSRDWAISGRERHVGVAREANLPFPMRSLRTPDFLYIRNFTPDRWPMGAPYQADSSDPDWSAINSETRAAFPDMDASPTKTWIIAHGHESQWKKYFEIAFGKRPAEELYDVKKDPYQINNLSSNPAYAIKKQELSERLIQLLKNASDPRVTGDGTTFDRVPFTDPEKNQANSPRKPQ